MKTNNNGNGNGNGQQQQEADRLLNRNAALCGAVTAVSMS